MSETERDDASEPLRPHENTELFGHAEAEQALLKAYRGRRFPHAWLIGGPLGVGKATLAFRLARFIFAFPDPGAPQVQSATSLALPPDHPVSRRVAAQGQPDLLVLERTVGDTGKLRTKILVDDVRRAVPFFGSTAGEGGWRIAIVDSVDEMNASSANALLKVLEEPPVRALLLLVSHLPGRVLPTLRSRCRALTLRELSAAGTAEAAAHALGRDPDEPDLRAAAEAAEGSTARALALLEGSTLVLRRQVLDLLGQLPRPDPRALHALGDAIAGTEPQKLAAFTDTINAWLSERVADDPPDPRRLMRLATAHQRINGAARDTGEYNLERKPLVFNVFGWLAEASRG